MSKTNRDGDKKEGKTMEQNKKQNVDEPTMKIMIAMHKDYEVPLDPLYLSLQVGAKGKEPLEVEQRDDTGEEISEKNPLYCELTALYWGWKNLTTDWIGLVHYRRHFSMKKKKIRGSYDPMSCVLTYEEALELTKNCDIVVPQKRKYYIETLYSHYAHTLDAMHLDVAKEIVGKLYPEYREALDKVYNQTYGYMFNMFFMKKEELDAYASWLFPILEEMEQKISVEELGDFQKRLFGRVSEILWNVWLLQRQKQGVVIKEIPYLSTEPVNWGKKGMAFLKAKFLGKKYEASF